MEGKKYLKTNIVGFVIGILIISGVVVYAAVFFPSNEVTYDNGTSGLESNNVQGAIDEIYTECTTEPSGGDQILDNVDIVESGDGLYKDEYEDGKYTYKGANPNNYVTFNDETAGWRIISINSDGTIKIIKNGWIGNMTWDTSNSNNWARPATLNTYLNGTYYNSLTSTAQSQIVAKDYGIGKVTYENNNMQDQISDENKATWNGKVALPTLSEYIRACSNTSCKTFSTYNSNFSTCLNSDWMYNSNNWWTLSPYSDSYNVFRVYMHGGIYYDEANYLGYAVCPVVTLSSSVQITGGNGTKNNPFTIQ